MTGPDLPAPGKFDFHLSAAQEVRAERLHRESIVVDLVSQGAGGNIFSHYPQDLQNQFNAQMDAAGGGLDALGEAFFWPYEMSRLGKSHLLRDWLQSAGLNCGTYGVEVHDGTDTYLNQGDELTARYAGLPWLRHVTTAAQIRQAKKDGVIALYGHCQPTAPLPRNLAAFDRAYSKGLRSFMLTYNQMNNIGVGCTERVDAGLSTFGIEVVEHCNKIGLIVDVSHCGHLTTLDACRHSKKPVNANHTSARSLSFHARGKSNEALRAIADTGGVIGVVTLPIFLTRESDPTIEHMLDHIDYISNLVGWQHVAIGSDSPLQAPDEILRRTFMPAAQSIGFRPQDQLDITKRLIGFDDCRDLVNITRGLVSRGYDEEQIKGILGENALRVFTEVCGE